MDNEQISKREGQTPMVDIGSAVDWIETYCAHESTGVAIAVPLACARSFEAVRAAGGDCESCRRSAVLHESVYDRSAVLR